jgi:hypothetical protein
VGSLFLGVAALAGERLHLMGDKQAPTAALVVGLVSDGRDKVIDMGRDALRSMPVDKMRSAVNDAMTHARTRGQGAIASSKADASDWLQSTAGAPRKWAETKAIPQVMDDMTPYMAEEFMPKMIDAMMPHIRETVVPALIDDLTVDPRIRKMITEQSHGAVSAAADELRQVTASADDQVESAFKRTFTRHHTP